MPGVKHVGDLLHRTFFRTLSLLGSRGQGALLRRYFDWWHRKPDPWHMGTDAYEQAKYAATLTQIPDRAYGRILEVGCSEGVFTELLTRAYPEAAITALDISERALARAAERVAKAADRTTLLAADILTFTSDRAFDLVFCAETLYYLGRRDRLKRASEQLARLLSPGGVLVHPWPEARRLHRFVHAGPLLRVSELVENSTHRPFAVAVYEARPAVSGTG